MSAFASGREGASETLTARPAWWCGEGWAAWLSTLAKVQASLFGDDPSGKERMGALLSIYKPDRGKWRPIHGPKPAEISFCLISFVGVGAVKYTKKNFYFLHPMREAFGKRYTVIETLFKQNPWVLCPDLFIPSQGSILLASHVSLKEVRRQLYVSCKTLL